MSLQYPYSQIICNITKLFSLLLNQELSEDNLRVAARFFVLMHDYTSSFMPINKCRQRMSTKKGRSVESIPPEQDALVQHIKKALLQCKYVKLRNGCI